MRLLVFVTLLAGCIEHAELREQQCAHRCIERHGARPAAGAYGSVACGDRCSCTLWNGRHVDEGKLTSSRWPE